MIMTISKVEQRSDERASALLFENIDNIASIKRLLQQRKADPNSRSGLTGNAPLHFLAEKAGGSIEVAEHLLEHGADVNATNFRGETPLILACNSASTFSSRTSLVKLLLKQEGIDIDAVDKSGRSACTYAVKCSNVWIVKELLRVGASVTLREKTLLQAKKRNISSPTLSDDLLTYSPFDAAKNHPAPSTNTDGDSDKISRIQSPYEEAKKAYLYSRSHSLSEDHDATLMGTVTPPNNEPEVPEYEIKDPHKKHSIGHFGGVLKTKTSFKMTPLAMQLMWDTKESICYQLVRQKKKEEERLADINDANANSGDFHAISLDQNKGITHTATSNRHNEEGGEGGENFTLSI